MAESTKYKFSFGEFNLFDDKLIVENADLNFKALEKKYPSLAGQLSPGARAVLEGTVEKKKTRVQAFKLETKPDLESFLNGIADKEGITPVTVEEQKPAASAAPAAKKPAKESADISISILERIDFTEKHDGTLEKSGASGTITASNRGKQQPVFDVTVELDGTEYCDLDTETLHLNELYPGDDWTKNYTVTLDEDVVSPLEIVEKINTSPNSDVESLFFILDKDTAGQDATMSIAAKNGWEDPLTSITILKTLPDVFRDVSVVSVDKGTHSLDSGQLAWTIDALEPGETASITLKVKAFPDDFKPYPSGEISATYAIDGRAHVTFLESALSVLGSQGYAIDLAEKDEIPDEWFGTFTFMNRSEFTMHVGAMVLPFTVDDGEIKEINIDGGVDVAPGDEWTSPQFEIASKDEPRFQDNVLAMVKDATPGFSITPVASMKAIFSTILQPMDIPVVALEGEKTFDTYQVASYRESMLEANIDARVHGTAYMDSIHVVDQIPKQFKNPVPNTIKVTIAGKDIPQDDYTVTFDPDSDDPSIERKMSIDVKDLLDKMGGPLEDGSTMNIVYKIVAFKPEREITFDTQTVFQGYIQASPKPLEVVMHQAKTIEVVHQRRKTRVGKAIAPGEHKGDYEIALVYKNKGNFVKSGVEVQDFLPDAFEIVESNMEYQKEAAKDGDGLLLRWTLPEMQPDQEVEIDYSVHTDQPDASLKSLEGKSFK
jgi:hypothetical protein